MDAANDAYEFGIRLIVRHPSILPEVFTEILGFQPKLSWAVGTQRVTLKGKRLPGDHKETLWSYGIVVKHERSVEKEVRRIIGKLCERSDFLSEVARSGGVFLLTIDLKGRVNIGSVLPAALLREMGNLDVDLGFEVFPPN